MDTRSSFALSSTVLTWCVLHINNRGSSLIWSPQSMEKKFIQKADAKLGSWYHICDDSNTLVVAKPLFETRVECNIVEIKAAVVFFKDQKFHNAVGYSPGFGRVGCFIPSGFQHEKMYSAWIAYMEFFPLSALHTVINLHDVAWVIFASEPPVPISLTELHYLTSARVKGAGLAKGMIVEKAKEVGATGKIFNYDNGIYDYEQDVKNDIALGQFVKFVPMHNFSNYLTAVHVYELPDQNGIRCLQTSPEIKLSVSNWNINPINGLIDVPGLCSNIVDENGIRKKKNRGNLEIIYDKAFKCFLVPKLGRKRVDSVEADKEEMAKLIAELDKMNEGW